MLSLLALPLVLLVLLASGCATPEPSAFRHPDFKPTSIRRPAVVLQVSLEQTELLGEGEFSRRERSSIPDAVEIALLEGHNAEGILPVDVTPFARGSSRDSALAFERIDRTQALKRARTLNADVLLIADVSRARQDLVYCRAGTRASGAGGRPFVARTTLWTLGAEVLRVADGTRLLRAVHCAPSRGRVLQYAAYSVGDASLMDFDFEIHGHRWLSRKVPSLASVQLT